MIHTLTKEALAKKEELLLQAIGMCGPEPTADKEDFYEKLEEILTSTITRLLEAEVERLKGMKKEKQPRNYKPSPTETKMEAIKNRVRIVGYNTALQEQIDYLQSEIEHITNLSD